MCGSRSLPTGLLLAAVLAACGAPRPRATECIAPANPGGGWDLTCRAVGGALAELGLVRGSVQVTNLPGAGGGVAYAQTVAQRAGQRNVLIAASPATTLRLAQGQYGELSENHVRWLAAVAADYAVIAVRADAGWRTLPELLAAWRAAPARVVAAGGSAVGGQDHMKLLVLARAAGLDPRRVRYVPFDGGGEALTALLGGFVQVFSGDATEVRGHLDAGAIRVLAVLAPDRVPGPLADVPTAREAGYAVDWITWRGFYLPAGVPDSAYDRWQTALAQVEASPAWARARETSGLAPLFVAGAQFEQLVRAQVQEFRSLSRELGLLR